MKRGAASAAAVLSLPSPMRTAPMRTGLWNAPAAVGPVLAMIAALSIVGACTRESADDA